MTNRGELLYAFASQVSSLPRQVGRELRLESLDPNCDDAWWQRAIDFFEERTSAKKTKPETVFFVESISGYQFVILAFQSTLQVFSFGKPLAPENYTTALIRGCHTCNPSISQLLLGAWACRWGVLKEYLRQMQGSWSFRSKVDQRN